MEHKLVQILWLILVLVTIPLATNAFSHSSLSSAASANQNNTSGRAQSSTEASPMFSRNHQQRSAVKSIPMDRIAGWRADLDALIKVLREKHWHYRDAPFPAAFEKRAGEIRKGIPQLTDDQIVVEFQALLATLHDGHTLVYPFGMKHGGLSHLPITLYDFDDGLAVVAADPPHAFMIGRRVLSIGGVPVAKLLDDVTPFMSLENNSQRRWVYPTYLTFPAFLRDSRTTSSKNTVEVLIETDSDPQTVSLSPEAPPIDPDKLTIGLIPPPLTSSVSVPIFLSRLRDAYWFTTTDEVVYLQMNRVANSKDEPLDGFSIRLLQTLLRPQTRALIVDLRNNSGGNGALLPPLIRSIVTFRGLHPTAPIYVLIGRQTFSAAQTFVNRLEEYVDPIFVGEETGSKPNRFGNGSSFQLPYSGVMGEISTGYNQAATSRDTRTTTVPTIRIGMKIKDWLAGRDVVLDRVKDLLAQKQ